MDAQRSPKNLRSLTSPGALRSLPILGERSNHGTDLIYEQVITSVRPMDEIILRE